MASHRYSARHGPPSGGPALGLAPPAPAPLTFALLLAAPNSLPPHGRLFLPARVRVPPRPEGFRVRQVVCRRAWPQPPPWGDWLLLLLEAPRPARGSAGCRSWATPAERNEAESGSPALRLAPWAPSVNECRVSASHRRSWQGAPTTRIGSNTRRRRNAARDGEGRRDVTVIPGQAPSLAGFAARIIRRLPGPAFPAWSSASWARCRPRLYLAGPFILLDA